MDYAVSPRTPSNNNVFTIKRVPNTEKTTDGGIDVMIFENRYNRILQIGWDKSTRDFDLFFRGDNGWSVFLSCYINVNPVNFSILIQTM